MAVRVHITPMGKAAGVKPPRQAYPEEDCAYDFQVAEGGMIWPFTCRKLATGQHIEIPRKSFERDGVLYRTAVEVCRRTGLALKLIAPGPQFFDCGFVVPDAHEDYEAYNRGWVIGIMNLRPWPYFVKPGERMAQLAFQDYRVEGFIEVQSSEIDRNTARTNMNFGSSGRVAWTTPQ